MDWHLGHLLLLASGLVLVGYGFGKWPYGQSKALLLMSAGQVLSYSGIYNLLTSGLYEIRLFKALTTFAMLLLLVGVVATLMGSHKRKHDRELGDYIRASGLITGLLGGLTWLIRGFALL